MRLAILIAILLLAAYCTADSAAAVVVDDNANSTQKYIGESDDLLFVPKEYNKDNATALALALAKGKRQGSAFVMFCKNIEYGSTCFTKTCPFDITNFQSIPNANGIGTFNFNDQTSSIWIEGQVSVAVYQHKDYNAGTVYQKQATLGKLDGYNPWTFRYPNLHLAPYDMGDMISSAKCY